MARLSDKHMDIIAGGTGPCSVPMWQGGSPSGFCDRTSYGEQFQDPFYNGAKPSPFATHWCCDHHGGPSENSLYFFVRDGNQWCAYRKGFENLQESHAGFGLTQERALSDLIRIETQETNDG